MFDENAVLKKYRANFVGESKVASGKMTMVDTNDKVNGCVSFRFLGLSDKVAAELKRAIPIAEFGLHYKTKKNVGSIPIVDSSLIIKIDQFRRSNLIKPTECDIFVSIASTKNDEVWRAPKSVNYLVNIVGCPIVFSFTAGEAKPAKRKPSTRKKRGV